MNDEKNTSKKPPPTSAATTFIGNILDNNPNANNGLVVIQGTKVKLSWGEQGIPASAKGYQLQRAIITGSETQSLQIGPFEIINEIPWTYPYYTDIGVQPNTFYAYIVYLINADDKLQQWLPPLIFKTGDENIDDTMRLHIFGKGDLISLPSLHNADLNQDGIVDIADLLQAIEKINN